ncbi:hypothetical protein F6B93_08065 [Mycobacterium spongiae]|uniref:Transmembrane alanine and glycine rich protein n=1 Tax=Mycobacterium spongiae TaxID=886343 RepID=A0A975K1L2_9MYCO|nr:hypothetical protein F6B93_08065 [Mycobacterium spongiae]
MMAAWEQAGGETSLLGAREGDVYPVGNGFALDFDGGKMFFSEATGARFLYGEVLDKYESLGGPADSDLGFPTIDEVPGLAGPDSRVSTFSASDNPVIFWTAVHGAFVVRGPLNAAWDALGSSGGVLGVPIGDETYDGEVISQKFSGGEVSWNRQSKEFTTVPAVLADQLGDVDVPVDPTAAINMAWRAAGGAAGPLGAKKGEQYPIGGDGIVQDFVGGKVFFSPATGANAVEGDILAKYESLGGPVGSDLGFPIANESDGGIAPASRIVTFSAADKPVIFWTPDHGAFVVRGAMKAAWDKLRGPVGQLGAPVADQAVDGDVVSQQFSGGTISWNRADNTYATDPANLAPLLSGLQVPGQNQPSTSEAPPEGTKFTWHWWWVIAAVLAVLVIALLVLLVVGLRRRHSGDDSGDYELDQDPDAGYDATAEGRWPPDDLDFGSEQFSFGEQHPSEHLAPEAGPVSPISWPRGEAAAAGVAELAARGEAYGDDDMFGADEGYGFEGLEGPEGVEGIEDEDPDFVDTTPTPVVSYADLSGASEEAVPEPVVPETVAPETFATETEVPDARVRDAVFGGAYVASSAADAAGTASPQEADSSPDERIGRHAAVDHDAYAGEARRATAESASDPYRVRAEGITASAGPPRPSPAVRPTLHLPLEDPYQAPDGYPIKASARFGLYYLPSDALYGNTRAEIWFSSEEAAQANGFTRAD